MIKGLYIKILFLFEVFANVLKISVKKKKKQFL